MAAPAAVHPSERTLQSYGLGKLDDLLSEAVAKHLAACDSCRERVANMTSDTFLGRLQDAQARPASIPPVGSSLPGMSRLDGDSRTPPPPAASTLPPGLAEHPDYEVLRELGRGGMGVVYLARNKLMGRNEVLKVVGGHLLERPGVAERFLREIRSAAMLHHTNIVTAYSVLRVGQSLVFAMEYVEGFDLAQLVKGRGPLRVDQACNFIHQAALGLQYANAKGMVHRDIKPSNLIVARERKKPVVKVLDFGLSKVTSEGQVEGDSGLTREGQMLGTPDYIAPEQIRDAQSADIRADIYSLGCTLYCLLAGRPPFRGDNLWDLYQAHFSMNAGPLNLLRPEVPAELAALVAKMMAKEPRRRFQSPGEVAEALKPFFIKPAASRRSGSSAEFSRINPPAPPIQTPVAGPAPAQPATPVTAPTPPVRKSSKTGAEGVAWDSLIEINEDDSVVDAVKPKPADPKPASQKPQPTAGPVRRPPWMWAAVAAASLFGLIALGVIVIIVRGKNGETKITVRDDMPVKVESEDFSVEVNPRHISGPPGGAPKRQETVQEVKPLVRFDQKPETRITNSIGMKLVLIPAGGFMMGSPDSAPDAQPHEKPQHRVRITKPFYLGAHEVTRGQFQRFVDETGYRTEAEIDANGGGGWNEQEKRWEQAPKYTWRNPGLAQTDEHPVANVSWNDAVAFCEWLSRKEGTTCHLPTEAEWEYAYRAGTSTRFSFGEGEGELDQYAWYDMKSEGQTHPVGGKRPNAFGLYDMPGNVCEWCSDAFDSDYYEQSPVDDPRGPSQSADRVIRGGSWCNGSGDCRSASRRWAGPNYRVSDVGFRVARNVTDKMTDSSGNVLANSRGPSEILGAVNSDKSNATGPVDRKNDSVKSELDVQSAGARSVSEDGRPTLLIAPFDSATAKRAQSAWADHLKTLVVAPNSIGMKLILIPAGEFMMGSPDTDQDAENNEKPQHRVRITRPFYLGVHEVTQAQYQTVMGENPSRFSASGGGKDQVAGQSTSRHPVERVSWLDSVKFCNKLSETTRLKAFYGIDGDVVRVPDWNGPGYRLPTEAEWEYACRAGGDGSYSFGNDPSKLADFGWFNGNSGGPTHPVAEKSENAIGVFDMYGNVWEWCWDYYGAYESTPSVDPRGPSQGAFRVMRGGSLYDSARDCRSAYRDRNRHDQGYRFRNLGFRLARNVGAETRDLTAASATSRPSNSPKTSFLSPTFGPAAAVAVSPDGFVQLFNGRDLTGWKTHSDRPGNWRVEKGILVGSGPPVGNLYSDGASYKNFHLRVEARFNTGANSGVDFPVTFGGNWNDEYEVQVGYGRSNGQLYLRGKDARWLTDSHVSALEWFTLEVIADGDRIVSKINGQTVSESTELHEQRPSGHIALELCDTQTRIEFRKIEIKELNSSAVEAAAAQSSIPVGNPPAGEKKTARDADQGESSKGKAPPSEKSKAAPGKSMSSGAGKDARERLALKDPKAQAKARKNSRSKKTPPAGKIVGVTLEKIATKPSGGDIPSALSPDSQRLIHPMWSHFDVFDLRTGNELLSIDFRQIGARAVGGKGTEFCSGVVSSDGNPVVRNADRVIRVLDKSTCKVIREFQPQPLEEDIGGGLWASGQDRIVGRGQLDIRFWDSSTGKLIHKWNARDVIAMDVSPQGNHDVVTIHNDHMIRVWNVATGLQKGVLPDPTKRRNNIRFSRDGVRLLTWVSGETDFYLFDPDTDVDIPFPGEHGKVRQIAAFPDVPVLASGDSDGIVRLWDENEVTRIHQQKCLAPVYQVLISPDGNHLVVTLEREIIFYRVNKMRAEPTPKKNH